MDRYKMNVEFGIYITENPRMYKLEVIEPSLKDKIVGFCKRHLPFIVGMTLWLFFGFGILQLLSGK